jgi:hypothetical protein
MRYGAPLISGALVYGTSELGIAGSVIRATTATGDHGAGLPYNDWDSGDDAKLFRIFIETTPSSGSLFVYEDGSFSLTAANDGAYSIVYRLFADGSDLGTVTSSITVGSIADTTTPVLTAPSGTTTGTSTANGSVTTDEGNGTLYFIATTNPTESVNLIKTSGATQSISSAGIKSVLFTGLLPNTAYYPHFVHTDSAGNNSTVANGSSFITEQVTSLPSTSRRLLVKELLRAVS